MASWPASPFPQVLLVQGFAQREQSAVIRSPMGYGPAKVRARTTAAIQPVNGSLVLNGPDKDTLISFYGTTLLEGTQPFDYVDLLNNSAPAVYRFTSPIQWSPRGPDLWLAVMNFEILP